MSRRKKELTERDQALLKAIGEKLVELRKEAGFSNYENFAFEKGLNRSQYGKYEAGSIEIQITTLAKVIEKHENMTLEKFFQGLSF